MNKLETLEKEYFRKDLPPLQIGDTLEVDFAIREGDKTRLQTFSGILIARRGKGLGETCTVRKVSYGEGIEKTFPLHSPVLKDIRVIKKSKVRRAKLYYLRKKIGKKARLKESKDVTGSQTASQPK